MKKVISLFLCVLLLTGIVTVALGDGLKGEPLTRYKLESLMDAEKKLKNTITDARVSSVVDFFSRGGSIITDKYKTRSKVERDALENLIGKYDEKLSIASQLLPDDGEDYSNEFNLIIFDLSVLGEQIKLKLPTVYIDQIANQFINNYLKPAVETFNKHLAYISK